MKTGFLVAVGLTAVVLVVPARADQLLTEDEQSFESGPTPGRWKEFTWDSDLGITPSALGDGEDTTGDPIDLGTSSNAVVGSSSLRLYNTVALTGNNDTGGIFIDLPVIAGGNYTVTANFYLHDSTQYQAACGFSVDRNAAALGIGQPPDLTAIDYGFGGGSEVRQEGEMDSNRENHETGEWMWNETFAGAQENTWFGPDAIRMDVVAAGELMRLFLWGLSKSTNLDALVDGVSVDGPIPVSIAAGVGDWLLYP